jgi:CheY-like chemotaxis protein
MIDIEILKSLTAPLSLIFVEDDDNARNMYENIFRRFFDTVHTFSNGKEAYEFYQNNSFSIDLIITDITMPIMSGIELAEKIKDLHDDQKIIVLSAHDDKDKIFSLINLGVDGFIVKPPSIEDLQNTLFKVATIINDKKELLHARNQIAFKNKVSSQQAENKAVLMNTIKMIETQSQPVEIKSEPVPEPEILPIAININEEYSSEDISEMREIIDDIDFFIAKFFGTSKLLNIDLADTEKLANLYARYSFILKSYSSFTIVSEKLFELSCILRSLDLHEHEIDISHIGDLLECINQSLLMFQKQVMEEQSVNPNFYDASLMHDIDMTIATVVNKHVEEAPYEIEFF